MLAPRALKKVIVFGNMRWLEDIETILKWDADVIEVVKAMSIGMSAELLEKAEQHQDADAFIILGRAIRNMLPLALRKLRLITKVPVLVVMSEALSDRKKNNLKTAGATAVLAQEVITNRELIEAFMKMMPKRPELRLVKSDTRPVNI